MRHYAISKKAKLFKLFDAGKRPSDIDKPGVSRPTMYQYWREWRLERGIPGKVTGFAIKKFDRRARLKAIEAQRRKVEADKRAAQAKERAAKKAVMTRLAQDYEAIANGFKRWHDIPDEDKIIYLPGSGYNESLIKWELFEKPTLPEYVEIYRKWAQLAKQSENVEHFKRLCNEGRLRLPPRIDFA